MGGGFARFLDRYFRITERNSKIGTEVKAGICTFMTMSYILLVNGQILGAGGLDVRSVVAATALASCVASFLAGVLANVPFGVSPGMGLNAFLVFSQVLGLGVTPQSALAGCMLAALIVGALAACRALNVVLSLVPDSIKLATVVGMGLLLSFIGLQTARVVVPDAETMVTLGDLSGSLDPALACAGLALIAALHYRNVRGSIIVGILATALARFAAEGGWPTQVVALPHLQRINLDYSMLLGGGAGGSGGGGGGGLSAVATAAVVGSSPRRRLLEHVFAPVLAASSSSAVTTPAQSASSFAVPHPSPSLTTLASAASRAAAERVRLSALSSSSSPSSSAAAALLLLPDHHSDGGNSNQQQPPLPHPPTPTPKPTPQPPPKKKPSSAATRATAWSAVCAYSLVMVFDIGGAMFGLGSLAGLVRRRKDGRGGELPGATWVFLAACLGTALGAATGTTPLIIAAESAVGIKEGGRTGLVAVVISLCFAASCFVAPLLQAIPQVATSPVLVLVGAMMMGESVHIDWGAMPTAVPAFLTIVVQPFTFSIANGIYAGVLMSAALFVLTGAAWAEARRALFGIGGGGGGGVDGNGLALVDGVDEEDQLEEEEEAVEEEEQEAGLLPPPSSLMMPQPPLSHDHHHHHHHPLPFEEPLLTNTYGSTPTPYKAPTAPRPIGGGGGAAHEEQRPVWSDVGGGGGSSDAAAAAAAGGGAHAAAVAIPVARSSSMRRGSGSVLLAGSLSRLASSLTRPNTYERASFAMLTNTAAGGGGGGGASGGGGGAGTAGGAGVLSPRGSAGGQTPHQPHQQQRTRQQQQPR